MKEKNKQQTNYLEIIFSRKENINWSQTQENEITLEIENKGIFNRIAQKILKKPKVSYIHLDEIGSFIWPLIDEKSTVGEISEKVESHFGEKAHPLYERLVKYFQILESYNFIVRNNQ